MLFFFYIRFLNLVLFFLCYFLIIFFSYSSNDPSTKKRKKHKNKKSKRDRNRYFLKSFGRENEEKMDIKNPDPIDIEEFLKQTENFNKSLRAEPSNVKMWLDYVKLQVSSSIYCSIFITIEKII